MLRISYRIKAHLEQNNGNSQFHAIVFISISIISNLIQDSICDRPISFLLSLASTNYHTSKTEIIHFIKLLEITQIIRNIDSLK